MYKKYEKILKVYTYALWPNDCGHMTLILTCAFLMNSRVRSPLLLY